MPIQVKPNAGFKLKALEYNPPRPKSTVLSGYSGWEKLGKLAYNEDTADYWTSPKSLGHVGMPANYELASHSFGSDYWTRYTKPKSVSTTSPIFSNDLFAKPGQQSKLGNFSLSLIKLQDSLGDAATGGLGMGTAGESYYGPPSAWYEQLGQGNLVGTARGLLQLQGEAPALMVDRWIAPVTVAFDNIFGTNVSAGIGGSQSALQTQYPFQQTPGYWDWLRKATPEQLKRQAEATAYSYLSAGRAKPLVDALLKQFTDDAKSLDFLSSGDEQVDYRSKKYLENALGMWREIQSKGLSPTQLKLAGIDAPPQTFEEFLALPSGAVQSLRLSSQSSLSEGMAAVGVSPLLYLPFIGTPLTNILDPASPETQQAWNSLSAEQRRQFLVMGGDTRMVSDLALGLLTLKGAGVAIGAVGKAIATGGKVGTAATVASKGYSLTLNTLDKMMAVGVANTMATGMVLAAAKWEPTAGLFGKGAPLGAVADFAADVDAARPLTASPIGGVLVIGANFASGTAGFNTFLRTNKYITGEFAKWTGGKTGVMLMGVRESPFFSYRYGGSRMGSIIEKATGITADLHRQAMNVDFYRYVMRMTDEQKFRFVERAMEGQNVEGMDGLTMKQVDAALKDALNFIVRGRQSTLDFVGEFVSQATAKLPGMVDADTIGAHNVVKSVTRTLMESVVAEQMSHYGMGTTALPKSVAELRKFVAQRVAAIDAISNKTTKSDMTEFDRRLGTAENARTLEAWTQLATSMQSIHYSMEDSALHALLKVADHHEPGLTIWHQRNAFQQDIESYEAALASKDPKLVATEIERLMKKEELRAAYSQETGKPVYDLSQVDPELLGSVLASIRDTLPRAREVPEAIGEGQTLNAFHVRLVNDGVYTLGYRAKVALGPELTLLDHLHDLLKPREFMIEEPRAVQKLGVADKVPDGYIELPPDVVISRKNFRELGMYMDHEGHFWIRDDATVVDKRTGTPIRDIAAGRAPGPRRAGQTPRDMTRPYAGDGTDLPRDQAIAVDPNQHFPLSDGGSWPLSEADLVQALEPDGTPMLREGGLPGARYPVLEDMNGHRFIFKGEKGFTAEGEPTKSMTESRLQGEVASATIPKLLGINVAEVIPFEYHGYRGFLQEMFPEVVGKLPQTTMPNGYSMFDYTSMSEATLREVIANLVSDIVTWQYDTNSGAFLLTGDAGTPLASFDKGQGMAFLGHHPSSSADYADVGRKLGANLDDGNPWQDWNMNGYAHLNSQVGYVLREGIDPRVGLWDAYWEDIITRIEGIPDDVWLAVYEPMLQARVADNADAVMNGRMPKWDSLENNRAAILDTKRKIRDVFATALRDAGYMARDSHDGPITITPGAKGALLVGDNTVPLNALDTSWVMAASSGTQDALLRIRLGYDGAGAFDEPAFPSDPTQPVTDHPILGVAALIAEEMPDGSRWVWSHMPDGDPMGSERSFAFTTTAGDLRRAAYEEAKATYGVSTKLTAHLADIPTGDGHFIRTYLAERIAGGPRDADPTRSIEVGIAHPDVTETRLVNGDGDPLLLDREMLAAFRDHFAQADLNKENGLAPDGSEPPMPDDTGTPDMAADPDQKYGYVTHARLPNGSIFRSPWLDMADYNVPMTDHGSRGYIGRLYDKVFQGWRTNRILETQHAGLHLAVSKMIPGVNPEQVSGFFRDLQDMRRKELVGFRGAEIHPSMQYLAWHRPYDQQITELAVRHFGEGPFIGRDGVTRSAVDWPQVVARAFRQSSRLNFTAGVTSFIKALPYVGPPSTWVADFAYPTLRFGISPLFKGGERMESAVLNWMNFGLGGVEDVFANSVLMSSGFRSRIDPRLDDMQTDPMLSTLDQGVHTATFGMGRESFFGLPVPPNLLARAYAAVRYPRSLWPREGIAPDAKPTFAFPDMLSDTPRNIPADPRFPDSFPVETMPRNILPELRDPVTGEVLRDADGNPMLDFSPDYARQNATRAIAGTRRGMMQRVEALNGPSQVRAYQSLALIDRMTADGTIAKLAAEALITHVAGQQHGVQGQLTKYFDTAVTEGLPLLGGRLTAGADELVTTSSESGGLNLDTRETAGHTSNTPSDQAAMGLADSRFISFHDHGSWQAYGTPFEQLGMHFILKKSILDRAIVSEHLRVAQEPSDYMAGDVSPVTAAGMLAIEQARIQSMLLDFLTDAPDGQSLHNWLTTQGSTRYNTATPFLLTLDGGIDFTDLDALMIHPTQMQLVQDWFGAHRLDPRFIKEGTTDQSVLDDIALIPARYVEDSYSAGLDSRQAAIWSRQFTQAGLSEMLPVTAAEFRQASLDNPFTTLRRIDALDHGASLHQRGVYRLTDGALEKIGYRTSFPEGHGQTIDEAISLMAEHVAGSERTVADMTVRSGRPNGNAFRDEKALLDDYNQRLIYMKQQRVEYDRLWSQTTATHTRDLPDALREEIAMVQARITAASDVTRDDWRSPSGSDWERHFRLAMNPGFRETGMVVRTPDGGYEMLPVARPAGIDTFLTPRQSQDFFGGSMYEAYEGAAGRVLFDYAKGKVPDDRVSGDLPTYLSRRNPTGAGPRVFGDEWANAITGAVSSDHFMAALQAEASARAGGVPVPKPTIKAYIVSDADMTAPTMRLVVQVTGADGRPYGNLTHAEIQEVWERTGYPAEMELRASAGSDLHFMSTGRADPNAEPSIVVGRDVMGARNTLYLLDYESGYQNAGAEVWNTSQGVHDYETLDPSQPRLVVEWTSGFQPRPTEMYFDFQTQKAWKSGYYVVIKTTGAGGRTNLLYERATPTVMGSAGDLRWRVKDEGGFYEATPGDAMGGTVPHMRARGDNIEAARVFLADMTHLMDTEGKDVKLVLPDLYWQTIYADLYKQGAIDKRIVAVDSAGAVIDDAAIASMTNPLMRDVLPPDPPATLEEVPGTPEHLLATAKDQMAKEAELQDGKPPVVTDPDTLRRIGRATQGKVAQGWDFLMNPMPQKSARAEAYAREWFRRNLPGLVEQFIPAAAKLMNDLGVPKREWADFIAYDRYLTAEFLRTQDRTKLDELIAHAERYRPTKEIAYPGFSMSEARLAIDEFTMSPEYDALTDLWRIAIRAAEDEAYNAHFFNLDRSTIERSLNHPIAGIYPLSWSLKMARQWANFLFMNRTFNGIYLGAAPAYLIRQIAYNQGVLFAKYHQEDLDEEMTKGPLAPAFFMFNLLLPGDWANLPFPLTRTVRDIVRNPSHIDIGNLAVNWGASIGVGRDARLVGELADEFRKTLAGEDPKAWQRITSYDPGRDPWTARTLGTAKDPVTFNNYFSYPAYVNGTP
jgi:hypothetical protein